MLPYIVRIAGSVPVIIMDGSSGITATGKFLEVPVIFHLIIYVGANLC
jgi:hypothetical protein